MNHDVKKILKQYWGYDAFRSIQEQIIESVLNGTDTLGLMPTGGGKSITFQVPALAREGLCLVITPLIALMTDQVDRLRSMGIPAMALHAGLSRQESLVYVDNAVCGAYKFLYVSPERLQLPVFVEKLKQMPLNLITVDEAHCISQWGYDFRPTYLQIATIRKFFPQTPVLALTATATPEVVEDIQRKLEFATKNVIQSDFARTNLVYYVRPSDGKNDDLLQVIRSIRGSGIIYVRNRRKTREIAEFLNKNQVSADFYHAGLSFENRQYKQQRWTESKIRVMVATNAFGMGIDKPDVRFVIHLAPPDSLEAYFQEAGRAGRDGKKSFAVLLVQTTDKAQAQKQVNETFPEIKDIIRVYEAVCNYLQVPIGGGTGQVFDFELRDFTAKFKLHPNEAYSALKIIEQQGYIQLTDELNQPSRIVFNFSRDDLYRFQVENSSFDAFIKLVLRSYTGLFGQYTPIDENVLAQRAGTDRDTIYQYLKALAAQKVIQYIPTKKTPLLIFIEPRLEPKSLYISRENYHDRKERCQKRFDAMYHYALSTSTCRSRLLLAYFGQKDTKECGQCDVCRAKNQSTHADLINEERERFLSLLQKGPVNPTELRMMLHLKESEIKIMIDDLLEKEQIEYNSQGFLVTSL